MNPNIVKITVIGDDKKGVIAAVTSYLYDHGANIEDIDQKVIKNLFQMVLKADISEMSLSKEEFETGLQKIEQSLKMEIKIDYYTHAHKPNMVLMVTHEDHCPKAILDEWKHGNLNANITLMIGSCNDLKYLADEHNIPFYVFNNPDRRKNEIAMLEFLKNFDIDLIVLARYMKILSPDFVWRYEYQIINIHPSLLPAFPGAQAYRQAYEKGVRVAGVTAHFVTMDLDQGPIIAQEAFSITPDMNLDQIKKEGQKAEEKALLTAVKEFLEGNLVVYWNKVHLKD